MPEIVHFARRFDRTVCGAPTTEAVTTRADRVTCPACIPTPIPEALARRLDAAQSDALDSIRYALDHSGGTHFRARWDAVYSEVVVGDLPTPTPGEIVAALGHDFPETAVALIEYRTLTAVVLAIRES